ncbi:hypothetical protein JCM10212_001633 [Sporobolomyces blumeae]
MDSPGISGLDARPASIPSPAPSPCDGPHQQPAQRFLPPGASYAPSQPYLHRPTFVDLSPAAASPTSPRVDPGTAPDLNPGLSGREAGMDWVTRRDGASGAGPSRGDQATGHVPNSGLRAPPSASSASTSSKLLRLPSLAIGSDRPLVDSSEWPNGSSPVTHHSASRGSSPYPPSTPQDPSAAPLPLATAVPPLPSASSASPSLRPFVPPISTSNFTGIPSGRVLSSTPSPRQTQSAHFPPSFVTTPASSLLSPHEAGGDRAPGLSPHVRSYSTGVDFSTNGTRSAQGPALGSWNPRGLVGLDEDRSGDPRAAGVGGGGEGGGGGGEESEFLAVDGAVSRGASPSRSALAGQPHNRHSVVADLIVGSPPPPLVESFVPSTSASPYDQMKRSSSYVLADETSAANDMAGVGRNSIIRSVRTSSPTHFRGSVLNPTGAGGLAGSGVQSRQGSTSPVLSVARLQLAPQPIQPREIIPASLSPQQRNSIALLQQQAMSAGQQQQQQQDQAQKKSLPPHLVPQPEICVECMMRDRDMADVDVTTPGIWGRESDADWREQLRWEDENPEFSPPSLQNGSVENVGSPSTAGSAESGYGNKRRTSGTTHSRESAGTRGSVGNGIGSLGYGERRRRVGRGQALTSGNLKAWTTMNPPAAAHRWRTLQKYLATQIHLLELERQARQSMHLEQRNRLSQASGHSQQKSRSSTVHPQANQAESQEHLGPSTSAGRARAKSSASRGVSIDETAAANRASTPSSLYPPQLPSQVPPPSQPQAIPPGASSSPYPTHPQYMHPSLASSGASIQSYSYGDQPWLNSQSRRQSSSNAKDQANPLSASPPKSPAPSNSSMRFQLPKFARSTTDLRSVPTPRSISPARNSLNVDDRRRSSSLWSKFRQSAGQSVLSFNPSASMMDMHLGLSQDKHGAPRGRPGYASSTMGGLGGGPTYPYHHHSYDSYPGRSTGGDAFGPGGMSRSDPAVARHLDNLDRDRALAASQASETPSKKHKKKGIKGFFSKLVGGGGGAGDKVDSLSVKSGDGALSRSAPATPASEMRFHRGSAPFDDDELAPPPPLSALANEPRYHQRSSSTSSVDSYSGPYTPPLHGPNFRSSYTMPVPPAGSAQAAPTDRQSVRTMGSYSSGRSRPAQNQQPPSSNGRLDPSGGAAGGGASLNRPSFDSLNDSLAAPRVTDSSDVPRDDRGSPEILVDEDVSGLEAGGIEANAYPTYPHPQNRFQKALPVLPHEHPSRASGARSAAADYPSPNPSPNFYPNYHPAASRSAYSLRQFPSRPLSPPDSADERERSATVGSRSGRKTRSTVFSFFGRKKSNDDAPDSDLGRSRAKSFDVVSRY